MGLENTFNKVEKPAEEKKLEVITSKEIILNELESYFEENKYEGELNSVEECVEYFNSCMKFLKSFELKPEMITEFNTKTGIVEEMEAFGLYLSALIQSSYNQGCNNFIFEEVNANCFGALLKGQPKNLIKITTKLIRGSWSLWCSENCSLTAKTINGNCNLLYTDDCLVEIQNYQ